MRRSALVLLLWSGAAHATDYWQDQQNTNGMCVAPVVTPVSVAVKQADGLLACDASLPCNLAAVDGSSVVCNGSNQLSIGSLNFGCANGVVFTNGAGVASADCSKLGWNDSAGVMTMNGYATLTQVGSPGAPAAVGTTNVWSDNLAGCVYAETHAGAVTHTAATIAATSNVCLTGLNADGTWDVQNVQAPLTACTDYVAVGCQNALSDISGPDNAHVRVTAIRDGSGVRWPTNTNTFSNGQVLNLVSGAVAGEAHITCAQSAGSTGDVVTAAGSCASSIANVNCGALPALTGAVTSSGASCATSLTSSSVAATTTKLTFTFDFSGSGANSNTWLLSGQGLYPGAALQPVEYPNDFKAAHIQVRANLQVNGMSAGTLSFFASLNGVGIAGTGMSFTSASPTGVTVGTNLPTGSTLSSDTYGFAFNTTNTYVSSFTVVTFEVVLTS